MATVNIRSDVSDSFYRYKMPRILAKVEGKGNGIKTVIPNMTAIGKSLSRPPSYSTKFFGCELGAQVTCDEKNDRYIVNGAHDAGRLAQLLDNFIKKFVLCGSCQNPETDLVITKDQMIVLNCKACGARTNADNKHKLVTFILKNPPKGSEGGGKGSKKDRRSKKAAKAAAANSADGASPSCEASQGNSGEEEDDSLAAEFADLPPPADDGEGGEADGVWSVDVSADAVARRMKDLAVDVSKFEANDDDDDAAGANKYDQFGEWLTANASASNDEIYQKAQEMDVATKYKALQVLVQAIFTEDMFKEISKRAPLLQKFGSSEKHQRAILGGVERFVGISHPDVLLPKVAIILKALYDADLLEEDVLLKWGAKPSKKYVDRDVNKEIRLKAQPFLNWLETAEEDSEEDEDEED